MKEKISVRMAGYIGVLENREKRSELIIYFLGIIGFILFVKFYKYFGWSLPEYAVY